MHRLNSIKGIFFGSAKSILRAGNRRNKDPRTFKRINHWNSVDFGGHAMWINLIESKFTTTGPSKMYPHLLYAEQCSASYQLHNLWISIRNLVVHLFSTLGVTSSRKNLVQISVEQSAIFFVVRYFSTVFVKVVSAVGGIIHTKIIFHLGKVNCELMSSARGGIWYWSWRILVTSCWKKSFDGARLNS